MAESQETRIDHSNNFHIKFLPWLSCFNVWPLPLFRHFHNWLITPTIKIDIRYTIFLLCRSNYKLRCIYIPLHVGSGPDHTLCAVHERISWEDGSNIKPTSHKYPARALNVVSPTITEPLLTVEGGPQLTPTHTHTHTHAHMQYNMSYKLYNYDKNNHTMIRILLSS